MGLYEDLAIRKRHGDTLDMKSVTYEILEQLSWIEGCSDAAIAELYGVNKNKIHNLRLKWGIKFPDTMLRAFEARVPQGMAEINELQTANSVSKEAQRILRRIEQLNDLDLESLRLALAQQYPVFANVRTEAEFFSMIEQVIAAYWTSDV